MGEDSLEQRLRALEGRVGRVEAVQGDFETRLAKIEALDEKVDRIETNVVGIREELEKIANESVSGTAAVTGLMTSVRDQETILSRIEKLIEGGEGG